MTPEEAREVLGVDAAAGPEQIREQYARLYNEYNVRLTNAPTRKLIESYQRALREMDEAVELLAGPAGGAADPTDQLPKKLPSWEEDSSAKRPRTAADEIRRPVDHDDRRLDVEQVTTPRRPTRTCPFCAEEILVQAKVCKHCGRDVTTDGGERIAELKSSHEHSYDDQREPYQHRQQYSEQEQLDQQHYQQQQYEQQQYQQQQYQQQQYQQQLYQQQQEREEQQRQEQQRQEQQPPDRSETVPARRHLGWWVLGLLARVCAVWFGVFGVLLVVGTLVAAIRAPGGTPVPVAMFFNGVWSLFLCWLFWWLGGRAFHRSRAPKAG